MIGSSILDFQLNHLKAISVLGSSWLLHSMEKIARFLFDVKQSTFEQKKWIF